MLRNANWYLFIILIVVIPIPLYHISPALLGRAILVGIFAILIIGFDLAVGYGGQINLGFQGFFAVGAYTTAVLTTRDWGPAFFSEPLVAMFVGCILAVIICCIISRPVLKTGGFFLAMVTLAFGQIVYTVANGWRFLGSSSGISGVPRFHLGSLSVSNDLQYYYLVWVFTILIIMLSLRLVNSRWGIALRAINSDETAAEVAGINVPKYKMEVLLVSAIYATVAGSLFAHYMRGVSPTMFIFTLLLMVTLALFFGGMGTVWGGVIGAALMQALPEGLSALARYWPWVQHTREIIYGIIFVGIIMLMPAGIFSKVKEILASRKSKQPTIILDKDS